MLQEALRQAEAKAQLHQGEHRQALHSMAEVHPNARDFQANMETITYEANFKMSQAQAVVLEMELARAQTEADHKLEVERLLQKLEYARHAPPTQTAPDFASPDLPVALPHDIFQQQDVILQA